MAQLIALAFSDQPGSCAGCEFGSLRIDTAEGSRACSFVRFAPPPSTSPIYIHAIVEDPGTAEPTQSAIEAFFRARYGNPPEKRLQKLIGQLTQLPVAQATLSLADSFVAPVEFDRARRSVGSAAPRLPFRRRTTNMRLLWLLATVAAAFVGFFAGRMTPSGSLPPVGTPPPRLELARRVERLEANQGPAGISLRDQLEYERKEHRRALDEKEQELREFTQQLNSPRASSDLTEISERIGAPASAPPSPPPAPSPLVRSLPESTGRAIVYADLLWVREGPGVEYPRISALDDGTIVDLSSRTRAGWVEISAPEAGWVAFEFLELIDPTRVAAIDEPATEDFLEEGYREDSPTEISPAVSRSPQ